MFVIPDGTGATPPACFLRFRSCWVAEYFAATMVPALGRALLVCGADVTLHWVNRATAVTVAEASPPEYLRHWFDGFASVEDAARVRALVA